MKDPNFKYCVTCKHHEAIFTTGELHYCTKDVPASEFCPVKGAGWMSGMALPCHLERKSDYSDCGPEGKCHEPIY